MNKLTIIGNLTRDPEKRCTAEGISVCSFSVAVNKRGKGAQADATDYFRVTAWRGLADNCTAYLRKGRKVCVVGPVTLSTYTGRDGQPHSSMEITAEDVEFLTPRDQQPMEPEPVKQDKQTGFVQVEEELPF